MQARSRVAVRRITVLGTLIAGVTLARPAAAHGNYEDYIILGGLVLISPAHVGADVSPDGNGPTRVVVGWSYQVPFHTPPGVDELKSHHRVVFGGDLLFRGGVGGRGRVGYRYATHWLFAGAGVAVSGAGVTLSPEVGAKFAHFVDDQPPSLHLLVRAEVAPTFDRRPTATIVLGWSLL